MEGPTQGFNRRQLGWMRRWHSQAHLRTKLGPRPANSTEWNSLLAAIEESIAKDKYEFSGLRWHTIRGKRALSTELLEDALVIRKVNDNIRRSYGLSQPNRVSLIRTAKQAIRENTPKTIIRIDLKSCFESISRTKLLKQIRMDAKVSAQTMALVESMFRRAARKFPGRMPEGIPRGLTVSTSLAELRLRELDSLLRMLPGVYLVLRYVDDLLIFTTTDENVAWNDVTQVVRGLGLRLNMSKSRHLRVACSCDQVCPHAFNCPCKKQCTCLLRATTCAEIEYLGYKLIFAKHNALTRKDPNVVYSILSERKAARLKTRIVLAANDCRQTNDWLLFEHRIIYLTSNQRIASEPGRRGLFNGLSYTHAEYKEPPGDTGNGTLSDLDTFYRTTLRRLFKAFGATPINHSSLEALSFQSGFHHRRRTKFTPLHVIRIKKCWVE